MSNKDSTVELDAPNNIFQRLYVCFKAMRIGFVNGCRPIIGLDRCFLKGPLQGQRSSAVGKGVNNQMYPIT